MLSEKAIQQSKHEAEELLSIVVSLSEHMERLNLKARSLQEELDKITEVNKGAEPAGGSHPYRSLPIVRKLERKVSFREKVWRTIQVLAVQTFILVLGWLNKTATLIDGI